MSKVAAVEGTVLDIHVTSIRGCDTGVFTLDPKAASVVNRCTIRQLDVEYFATVDRIVILEDGTPVVDSCAERQAAWIAKRCCFGIGGETGESGT